MKTIAYTSILALFVISAASPWSSQARVSGPSASGVYRFSPDDGLLKQVVRTDLDGSVVRRAGVMGIVSRGGTIRAGDLIQVELPPPPRLPLTRV